MIAIANPVYDEAFKFMMADINAATALLKALLGEDIEILELLPQEHSVTFQTVPQLSVVRFDYCATLNIKGERKKVLIELQKSKSHLDIGRFRRYLGTNYSDSDRLEGTNNILPIIAIYLFGFNMEGVEPAVTRFHPRGEDILEGCSPIEPGRDEMLELLTHTSYFVQLPKLPTRHKSRVGRVLSVFSQSWILDSDQKQLSLPEELKEDPELRPLVERLERALLDKETRRKITEEEAYEVTVANSLQKAEEKGKVEGEKVGIAKGVLQKALETAHKLKMRGFSNKEISEITELPESEIEALE
jgi:predicted transposase/invertase (TIGR01784 family)